MSAPSRQRSELATEGPTAKRWRSCATVSGTTSRAAVSRLLPPRSPNTHYGRETAALNTSSNANESHPRGSRRSTAVLCGQSLAHRGSRRRRAQAAPPPSRRATSRRSGRAPRRGRTRRPRPDETTEPPPLEPAARGRNSAQLPDSPAGDRLERNYERPAVK